MQLQNPLWAFALKVYSYSEVEQCCLRLQNQFGMSINRLLFAAWLATQHKLLDSAALQQSSAQQWQQNMTHPLRALRYQARLLRSDDSTLDTFYEAMRKAELEAERVELAHLCELAESWPAETGTIVELMEENVKRLIAEDLSTVDAEHSDLLMLFCHQMLMSG